MDNVVKALYMRVAMTIAACVPWEHKDMLQSSCIFINSLC